MGIFLVLIFSSVSFSVEKIWKKFEIELLGGISTMNPVDLNLWSDMNEKTDKFFNDDFFDYQASQNNDFSFTKIKSENIPRIKNALHFSLRLKFAIDDHIGISLGFKRLARDHNRVISSTWNFPYDYGEYQYRIVYDPYMLSVHGYIPSIGIHFQTPLKEKLSVGGFLEGGPLFGRCTLGYDYSQEWYSNEGNLIDRSSKRYLEEIGESSGFAVEGGLRVSISIGKFAPFFEGSYAYQKIKNLSGPGIERTAFLERTWEGEWGIEQHTTSRDWGELTYEYPGNDWGGTIGEYRDFNLDLSGFQFRIGIAYRF